MNPKIPWLLYNPFMKYYSHALAREGIIVEAFPVQLEGLAALRNREYPLVVLGLCLPATDLSYMVGEIRRIDGYGFKPIIVPHGGFLEGEENQQSNIDERVEILDLLLSNRPITLFVNAVRQKLQPR
jgi:hypothetical protein